jgi:Uma2 family endonuclease
MKTYRYSPRSFERALRAGVFGDRKVELLGGVPHVVTTNPPHVFVVRRLATLLAGVFAPDLWAIYEEKFIALGTWRPQPDIAVVAHPAEAYLDHLAGPDEIRLIVEVSDTTYAVDRGRKYRRYARAGIPEFWIVDLPDRFVEVFTDPQGDGYRSTATHRDGDAVRGLALADMLPPA